MLHIACFDDRLSFAFRSGSEPWAELSVDGAQEVLLHFRVSGETATLTQAEEYDAPSIVRGMWGHIGDAGKGKKPGGLSNDFLKSVPGVVGRTRSA